MNTQVNRLIEIKKKVRDMNDQICLICMGEYEKPAMLRCCHNMYCFECIMLVTNDTKKCPTCRSLIYQNSITIINKKMDEEDYQKKQKYDSLLEIIGNNINGKFMVFSNFTETFNKIQELLDKHHVSYSQLKGSAQEMTKTIDMVNEGKIKVLMLNANYQAGVNLEMITDLVFFHRASPQTEQQIIGRSHRLKRTNPLNIYYLLHQGENDDYEDIDIDQIKDLNYLEWLKN
jgi:SNF2 family DNA or RNA helicase